MKKLLTLTTVAALALTSCKSYKYINTSGTKSKELTGKVRESEVLVWTEKSEMNKEAQKIGIISVRKNSLHKGIKKAKKAAAANKANAILVTTAEDQTGAQKVGAFFIGGRAFKGKYLFDAYRL